MAKIDYLKALLEYITNYTCVIYPVVTSVDDIVGTNCLLIRPDWKESISESGYISESFILEIKSTTQNNLETMINYLVGLNVGGSNYADQHQFTITGAATEENEWQQAGAYSNASPIHLDTLMDEYASCSISQKTEGVWRFTFDKTINSAFLSIYSLKQARLRGLCSNGSSACTLYTFLSNTVNPIAINNYATITATYYSEDDVTALSENTYVDIILTTEMSSWLTAFLSTNDVTTFIVVMLIKSGTTEWRSYAAGYSSFILDFEVNENGPFFLEIQKLNQIDRDATHKASLRCEARWTV